MLSEATKWGRKAALISILATGYFAVAAVTAHVLRTDYDFFRNYISDYAIGPWGWIYGSAFWASCIGCFALAISLLLMVPLTALSRIGIGLLMIVGLTYAIDFFFQTDILPPGAPPKTLTGAVHFFSALLGWVLFIISAFLLTSSLERETYWKPWHPLLLSLAWLSLLLLMVLAAVVGAKIPFAGLAEKAFILDRNIWVLVVATLAFNAPAGTA